MPIAQSIYEKLTSQEEGRLCDDISEAACNDTPKSFVLILISYVFTKLGDAISNPKTTLAWVAGAVGAPAFVLGFLVPIRESGSMLPQLFIGSIVRQFAIRKWIWVLGSVLQSACIAGIGIVAMTLSGAPAGYAMLALVTLFSLSRALSSIASKDVLGKTVAKNKRGQLTGWAASAAGFITLVVGGALLLPAAESAGTMTLAILLLGAASLWLFGAAFYARIPERPGATEGGRNATQSIKRLNLLLDDAPFRRFVITRALLMCSALSAPFYIAMAQADRDSSILELGAFIIAGGLASLVSAPVWGRFADVSSKHVMIWASVLAAGVGTLVAILALAWPAATATTWLLPVAYFVLSIAHSGVRVGRKTYVVNLATENLRTDYVAISNTTIGVLLLMVGSVGALTPVIGYSGVLLILAAMGFAGALYGTRLKRAE